MNRCTLPYASWGWAEIETALGAFTRGQIRNGPDIGTLERQLGHLLGLSHVFAVNSGRTALRIGLESLSLLRSGRTEVIVPAYICPAVVNAVRLAGLTPIPAEIGPDLNLKIDSVCPLIGRNTLGIIVAHMYGCPANIGEFENLARAQGIFLIDDAAQVVGESVGGRPLGTFGDFGVLSFAQSKCIVTGESGGGGALICRNDELHPIVRSRVAALEPAQSRGRAFLSFLWNYLLAPLTTPVTYYWRRLVPAVPHAIDLARVANLDARLATCQLESRIDRRTRRIGILDGYAQRLSGNEPGIGFPQYAPDRYLARAMLLLPDGSDVALCRQELRSRSIETRCAYPVLLDAPDVTVSVKNTAKRLLEVPTDSSMQIKDVKYVCDCLGDILGKG